MPGKATVVPCGRWRAHAGHEYVHEVHGPVCCPGRAFDHWPGTRSKVPGL